ncbi:hypothetical protein ACFCT7_08870 [Fulvivirgaceae bacterium LMO-SS25]
MKKINSMNKFMIMTMFSLSFFISSSGFSQAGFEGEVSYKITYQLKKGSFDPAAYHQLQGDSMVITFSEQLIEFQNNGRLQPYRLWDANTLSFSLQAEKSKGLINSPINDKKERVITSEGIKKPAKWAESISDEKNIASFSDGELTLHMAWDDKKAIKLHSYTMPFNSLFSAFFKQVTVVPEQIWLESDEWIMEAKLISTTKLDNAQAQIESRKRRLQLSSAIN